MIKKEILKGIEDIVGTDTYLSHVFCFRKMHKPRLYTILLALRKITELQEDDYEYTNNPITIGVGSSLLRMYLLDDVKREHIIDEDGVRKSVKGKSVQETKSVKVKSVKKTKVKSRSVKRGIL